MKVDILAIGAHPDDVELGCGGTLAKLFLKEKSAIVDLTQGELEQEELEIRHQEATEAARILGVEYRENLK
jgi:LmbE family N-acetylglucosaminyl deacetylase